jgi:LmbE family N-acetylglucosaminyl deacetylase
MDKTKQSIVAFGAHPDDVEIGMGGTVAKLARNGYDVHLVIATLPNFTKIDIKEQRRHESALQNS